MMTTLGRFRALRLHGVRKNVYVGFQLPAELVEMLVADTELLKKVPERRELKMQRLRSELMISRTNEERCEHITTGSSPPRGVWHGSDERHDRK